MTKSVKGETYQSKLASEVAWYHPQLSKKPLQKLFKNPAIYSMDRILFSYEFPKEQLVMLFERHETAPVRLLLNAPSGPGNDLPYLRELGREVHGVDLSPEALSRCPAEMPVAESDIMRMPYRSNVFDTVFCPLFFHHFVDFGFTPFLQEFFRVLRPGGSLLVLEPSILYPLNLVTRPVKWIAGNPYDEVADERAFVPQKLLNAMKNVGFTQIEYQAASFSHPVFPIFFAKAVNRLTTPLLNVWPLKLFGWMIGYFGVKPA